MTSLMNKMTPSSFATKAAVMATNTNIANKENNPQNSNQIDKVVESVANANKRLSQTSTSSNKRKSDNSIGPWRLGRTLGRGSTGRVRLAKHASTGQLSAVKIVPKSTNAIIMTGGEQQPSSGKKKNPKYDENGLPYGIEREIIIMKLISHPNIMALYDVWENSNELYLVLEYVEGGELFDFLIRNGRLTEREAVNYFKQIIRGVEYCHRFNICHRDLKPENILLDKYHNIKIADFGMAALETNSKLLETSCGSPHYASPEIVAGKNYHGSPSDVWSCGIILFALLSGHLPFDDSNIRKLLLKVQTGKFHMPSHLGSEAKDLIWSMLRVNPKERISIHDVLKHPLVLKYPDAPADATSQDGNPNSLADIDDNFDLSKPVTKIDQSILKNLQTLWHGIQLDQVIQKLQSREKNYEKIFYYLLSKYKEEHFGYEAEENLSPHSRSNTNNQTQSQKSIEKVKHSSVEQEKVTKKSKGKSSSLTNSNANANSNTNHIKSKKSLTRSGSSMIIKTTIEDENGEILKTVTKEVQSNDFNRQPLKRKTSSKLNIQNNLNNNNNAPTVSSSIKKSISFKSPNGKIVSRSNTTASNANSIKGLSPRRQNSKLHGSSARMIGRSRNNSSNSISVNPKDLPQLPDIDMSEFSYLVDTIFESNEKDDNMSLNFDLETVNDKGDLINLNFDLETINESVSGISKSQSKHESSESQDQISSTLPVKTLNPKFSTPRGIKAGSNKDASEVLQKFGVRMSRLDLISPASTLRNKRLPPVPSIPPPASTGPTSALSALPSRKPPSLLIKSQSSSSRNLHSYLSSANMNLAEYNQKNHNKNRLSALSSMSAAKTKHSTQKSVDTIDYEEDENYSLHSAIQVPISTPTTNVFSINQPDNSEKDMYADAEIENDLDISKVIFDDSKSSQQPLTFHRKVESVSTQDSKLNEVIQQPFQTIRCSLIANANYEMPEEESRANGFSNRFSLTPEKTAKTKQERKSKGLSTRESIFADPEDETILSTLNGESINRDNTAIFDQGQGDVIIIESDSDTEIGTTPTKNKGHHTRLSMQSANVLSSAAEDSVVARHAYSTLPFHNQAQTQQQKFFQTRKLEDDEMDGIDFNSSAINSKRESNHSGFPSITTASKSSANRIISTILGRNDGLSDIVDISPIEASFGPHEVSAATEQKSAINKDCGPLTESNRKAKKQLRFASGTTDIKDDLGGIINMNHSDEDLSSKRPNWFKRLFSSLRVNKLEKPETLEKKRSNTISQSPKKNKRSARWRYKMTTDRLFSRNNVYHIESSYLSSHQLIKHLEEEFTKLNSVSILSQASLKGSRRMISVCINDGLKSNELNFHIEIEDQEGYEFGFGGCFIRIVKINHNGSPKFFKTCCNVIERNVRDLEAKYSSEIEDES